MGVVSDHHQSRTLVTKNAPGQGGQKKGDDGKSGQQNAERTAHVPGGECPMPSRGRDLGFWRSTKREFTPNERGSATGRAGGIAAEPTTRDSQTAL